MTSYYDVLGVGVDSGVEEIRRAYLQKAQLLHPDRHVGSNDPMRLQAESDMKVLNEAWNTLKNPEARHRYDVALGLVDDPWAEPETATPPSFFRRAGIRLVIVVLVVAGLVGFVVATVVSGGGPPASEQLEPWSPAAESELRMAAIRGGLTSTEADCFVRYITSRYSPSDYVDVSIISEAEGACR
jgi:hypothetical protein